MSLLLKFTNASVKRIHVTFLLQEFTSCFSKQEISITIKKRFRRIYWITESRESFFFSHKPVVVFRKSLLYRKTFLDSTCFGLKTTRQVSLYLSDREMNWTSSFFRAEWWTFDRSAFASRSCRYSGEATRARICSSSKSESGGGVKMLSAES